MLDQLVVAGAAVRPRPRAPRRRTKASARPAQPFDLWTCRRQQRQRWGAHDACGQAPTWGGGCSGFGLATRARAPTHAYGPRRVSQNGTRARSRVARQEENAASGAHSRPRRRRAEAPPARRSRGAAGARRRRRAGRGY
eukprot:1797834-Prymnesium_polylepis.1